MYELTYASAARRLFDARELAAMLEKARLKNATLDITGILLYDAGSFIQLLEGDEATVGELFQTISRDARHDRIQVLRRREIATRSFSAWSMGFVTLDPQLMRDFPRRHGYSSNGSLLQDEADVIAVLDGFRSGKWHSYISG